MERHENTEKRKRWKDRSTKISENQKHDEHRIGKKKKKKIFKNVYEKKLETIRTKIQSDTVIKKQNEFCVKRKNTETNYPLILCFTKIIH